MIEIIGTELYQWDTGRSVAVTNIDAQCVHFANQGDSEAVIIEIENGSAKIPDYLLQTGKPVYAYVVANGVTIGLKVFSVRERERPENYIYEEDQRNYIYALVQSAEEATAEAMRVAEDLKTARDNGEFDGYTPVRGVDYWTEEDKEEIKSYVDEQIGTGGGGSAEGAVLYTPQVLTDEQKAQARGNIGAADGEIEKNFKKEASANLLNINDPDAFYGRIGGSGSNVDDDSLFTTGYIEAVTGETIYTTRENETSGLRVDLPLIYAYVYDSNKNRIALYQVGSAISGVFEITDANVAFVRVTFGTEWFESPNLMIAKSADMEYAEYGEVFAVKKEAIQSPVEEIVSEKVKGLRISKEQTDFFVPSVNLFDKTSELNQNNYALNSAEPVDGQTTRDDAQFITHPIPVKYGDVVRLNTDFNYIYGFAEDGSYKRAYTLSQYPSRVITIDRDTITQIRISFIKANIAENWIQSCVITVNNEMPEEYQPFGNIALSNDVGFNGNQEGRVVDIIRSTVGDGGDYLNGKILAAAGDSITYGLRADVDAETGWYKNYAALVALRHGMTYYNYGVSGSTLSNCNDKSFSVTRYQEMADNIDYLTIWFGWNDFAYSTLGTIDDTIDTTFYGAWNKVLPYLINKYPTAKIGLVVPYGTNADWRNAVRLIAKKFGLPYLDLMSESTPLFYEKEYEVDADVVALRKSTFLADGTHPNQTGYDYLSTVYENWLKSL